MALGWVAPKDPDTASQLLRYTIAFVAAARRALRPSEKVACCPLLASLTAGRCMPSVLTCMTHGALMWLAGTHNGAYALLV